MWCLWSQFSTADLPGPVRTASSCKSVFCLALESREHLSLLSFFVCLSFLYFFLLSIIYCFFLSYPSFLLNIFLNIFILFYVFEKKHEANLFYIFIFLIIYFKRESSFLIHLYISTGLMTKLNWVQLEVFYLCVCVRACVGVYLCTRYCVH